MPPAAARVLRRALDGLLEGADVRSWVEDDPVRFPRRFNDPLDIEVAGWLASALAYGRVGLFSAAIERVLRVMGPRPAAYALRFRPARHAASFGGLGYRFNSGRDIAGLVFLMGETLRGFGSVRAAFEAGLRDEHQDIGPALERFVGFLRAADLRGLCGSARTPSGLRQLVPSPADGGACKRWCMYLRWMARPGDGVDFGLWKAVRPGRLVVPMDTHVARFSRYLGLRTREGVNWRAALEVTRGLRRLAPEDPLRWDFALSHHGISGRCAAGRGPKPCRSCPLAAACSGKNQSPGRRPGP